MGASQGTQQGRVVGLTGKFAAGKGTVAERLRGLGYAYHSLSDILREELAARGIPESREALRVVGNEIRALGGAGALAERLMARLSSGLHIVDSIRTPAEVFALRAVDGFVLLGVDADARVRFERLVARERQGDPTSWEAFQAHEAKENASDDPTAQQLTATFALADVVVDNGGGLAELAEALGSVMARWPGAPEALEQS